MAASISTLGDISRSTKIKLSKDGKDWTCLATIARWLSVGGCMVSRAGEGDGKE